MIKLFNGDVVGRQYSGNTIDCNGCKREQDEIWGRRNSFLRVNDGMG